jgi:hypothetical protein
MALLRPSEQVLTLLESEEERTCCARVVLGVGVKMGLIAGYVTRRLDWRNRPFLTRSQAEAVSEEAQFHGKSSSSRLIG